LPPTDKGSQNVDVAVENSWMLIHVAPGNGRLADPRRTVEMNEPHHEDRPYVRDTCPPLDGRLAACRRWLQPRLAPARGGVTRVGGPPSSRRMRSPARPVVDTSRVKFRRVLAVAIALAAAGGCSNASPEVTVTNRTNQSIRLTGECIDEDAYTLRPGETANQFYEGAECRIDDGDGLNGMLGCIRLAASHTDVTQADLRNPPSPDQCWGSGSRH